VSVYGWQTIPRDQPTLAEAAEEDVFERYALRDVVGGGPLPGYNVRAMQTEKEHPLYGEAG
jgi:hypothetical protein